MARVFDGGSPQTAQGRALQPFVKPFHLPREQFDALIDGVAMDAAPMRFQTFADLEPYCHRVASSVGLICAEIFQYKDEAVLTPRAIWALRSSSRTSCVTSRWITGATVCIAACRPAACGCTEDDIRREVERGRESGHRKSVRRWRSRRVALRELLRPRCGSCRAAMPRASWLPKSCTASTSSCSSGLKRPTTTCSVSSCECRGRRRRGWPFAPGGRFAVAESLALTPATLSSSVPVARDWLPAHGWHRRVCGHRHRGSTAVGRAGHGVYGSGVRPAARQRPARIVRLLPRDLQLPARHRHGGLRPRPDVEPDDGGYQWAGVARVHRHGRRST